MLHPHFTAKETEILSNMPPKTQQVNVHSVNSIQVIWYQRLCSKPGFRRLLTHGTNPACSLFYIALGVVSGF